MIELFILLRQGGVGPINLAGQAFFIGVAFIIGTLFAPNGDPKKLATYYIFLFIAASLLMTYEEGYGKVALLGMITGLFLTLSIKKHLK
jgi:hypothetical protein